MSEVLERTLRVLGGWGGGEGPGWSAPTPAAPHSLSAGLAASLRLLTLSSRGEEAELCSKQIGEGCLFFCSCTYVQYGTVTFCTTGYL
jgi:hypothetical protein